MAPYPWKNKLLMLGLFALAYGFFYLYPNFAPPFPPMFLPMFWVDRVVPLIPWTFSIYLSDYLLFLVVIIMMKDAREFHGLSRKCFETLLICGTFFILMPTTYPRPPYPHVDNAIIRFLMNFVANGDTPNNCFPSMHVALTGAATWTLRQRGPKTLVFFSLWSIAIFISTLTTKQHYLLDVLGGMGVVAAVALFDWAVFETGLARQVILRKELAQKGFFRSRG